MTMDQRSATAENLDRKGLAQDAQASGGMGAAVWSLLGLAFVLRIAFTWKSFNLDEFATLEYAGRPLLSIFEYIARHDTHPPLYYILIHFWRYAGSGEVWVRLPGVLLGVGMCYLTYLIALQMAGRRVALMALFLAATAPTLVWVSQEARNYALMGFFAGLSTYCLIKILKDPKPKYWIGYTLAAAAGLYSFYYGVYVIVAQNVAFLIGLPRGWRTYRNWILAQLGIVVMFAPWAPMFLKQMSAVHSDATSKHAVTLRLLVARWDEMFMSVEPISISKLLMSFGHPGWFHKFAVAFTGLAFIGILCVLVRRRRAAGDWGISHYWQYALLITLIVVVVLESMVCNAFMNVFVSVRYCTFLSMFGCIIVAMLVNRIRSRAAYLPIIVILVLQLPALVRAYGSVENWQSAMQFLDENVKAGSFVGTVSYHSAPAARWYSHGGFHIYGMPYDVPGVNRKPGDLIFYQGIEVEDMPAIGRELRRHPDVWMIWSHVKRGNTDRGVAPMKGWFAANGYQVTIKRVYSGLEVEHYVRSQR